MPNASSGFREGTEGTEGIDSLNTQLIMNAIAPVAQSHNKLKHDHFMRVNLSCVNGINKSEMHSGSAERLNLITKLGEKFYTSIQIR